MDMDMDMDLEVVMNVLYRKEVLHGTVRFTASNSVMMAHTHNKCLLGGVCCRLFPYDVCTPSISDSYHTYMVFLEHCIARISVYT